MDDPNLADRSWLPQNSAAHLRPGPGARPEYYVPDRSLIFDRDRRPSMPRSAVGRRPQQQPLHSPLFPTGNMPVEETEEEQERLAYKRQLQNDRQKRKRARDAAAAKRAAGEDLGYAEQKQQQQSASVFYNQGAEPPRQVFQAIADPSYLPVQTADEYWNSPHSTYSLAVPNSAPSQPIEPIRTSTANFQQLISHPLPSQPHTQESVSTLVLDAQQHLNLTATSSLQTPFKLGAEGGWMKKRRRAVSNVIAPSYRVDYIPEDQQHDVLAHPDTVRPIQLEVVDVTPKRLRTKRSQSSPNTALPLANETPTQPRSRPRLELAMTPMPTLGFTSVLSSRDSPLCSPHHQSQGAFFASSLLLAFNSVDNVRLREGVLNNLGIRGEDVERMKAGIADVFDAFMAQRVESGTVTCTSRIKSDRQQSQLRAPPVQRQRPIMHHRTSSESTLSLANQAISAPLCTQQSLQASATWPYPFMSETHSFATPHPLHPNPYAPHIGNFSMPAAGIPSTPTPAPGSQLQQAPHAQPRTLAFYTPNLEASPTAYVQRGGFGLPGQFVGPDTPGSAASLAFSPVADSTVWHTPTGLGSGHHPS